MTRFDPRHAGQETPARSTFPRDHLPKAGKIRGGTTPSTGVVDTRHVVAADIEPKAPPEAPAETEGTALAGDAKAGSGRH